MTVDETLLSRQGKRKIHRLMPTSPRAAPRHALQERVAAAILEAAARVLAKQGEQANMTDVAAAAGVARATVYRYFPNRQALLDELAELALHSAAERLGAARIDEIRPVPDGITRAVRALVDVGDLMIVLARERLRPDAEPYERHVGAPLRALIDRGQSAGDIRDDIPSVWLADSLMSIVVSVLSSRLSLGRDDTVAAITGLFIDGARNAAVAA
jgi:TetR/AcrR family transcriptional repressor of mexCD-oprJ operon